MRALSLTLALVLSTSLLAGVALPALADGDKGRSDDDEARKDKDDDDADDERKDARRVEWRKHGGDKWLLRNDNVSVWFHQGENGKAKPSLKVFHADADGNRSGYSLDIKHVIELGDDGQVLNRLNLAKKDDWNVAVQESNASMTITMVRAEAQGIVTLVFYVSKASPSVKFDLKVDNWAWSENASSHKLALVMVAHERELRNAGPRNATLSGGYISWAPTGVVKYGNVSRVANVTASTGSEEGGGRLTLVFEAPGGYGSLDYDPTLGVVAQSASASERGVPAAPLAVALAAVAVVAVAARRRE